MCTSMGIKMAQLPCWLSRGQQLLPRGESEESIAHKHEKHERMGSASPNQKQRHPPLQNIMRPTSCTDDRHYINNGYATTVGNSYTHNIGGSKGAVAIRPSLTVQFLSFSYSCRQKFCQIIGVGIPPPALFEILWLRHCAITIAEYIVKQKMDINVPVTAHGWIRLRFPAHLG